MTDFEVINRVLCIGKINLNFNSYEKDWLMIKHNIKPQLFNMVQLKPYAFIITSWKFKPLFVIGKNPLDMENYL